MEASSDSDSVSSTFDLNSMSSSQSPQPENAEDVTIPTLSARNRFRLLEVPQKLQVPPYRKIYRTRKLGSSLGKLKRFMDLPMDVVFETAMYLHPKDLLQLSRLSKQFRSMFASRSATFVWQTVYRNIQTTCFKDLNEIQFASLLYDISCMSCGRITKGCETFPVLRLRLCPRCQTANFVTKDDLRNQYPDASAIIKFLPASMSDECFKPEAHLLIEKFLSLKNLEGKSRERFVSNMMRHTNVRGKPCTPDGVVSNIGGHKVVQRSCRRINTTV